MIIIDVIISSNTANFMHNYYRQAGLENHECGLFMMGKILNNHVEIKEQLEVPKRSPDHQYAQCWLIFIKLL